MPTSHAAVRHGVSWGKARRAEHAFLRDWDADRPRRRPRHLGADEIHRGKAQKFYTVLSDLVHGEVIGLAKDRTEDSLGGLLTSCLDARQRAAVEAVCTDMHRPYVNAVAHQLPKAEIVFDKFHVLQHASAALDDVRRQEFFRAGAVMRAVGRGKRWLLLRRWKTVRGSKRGELAQLFASNRRLFKAYVLREQLDRLWTYSTREGVARFLFGWLKALRWQWLPEVEKLGDTLVNHYDGIAAYCDHPVRFGVVESLNTTIKAVLRRARGMRDEPMLLLKLKWVDLHREAVMSIITGCRERRVTDHMLAQARKTERVRRRHPSWVSIWASIWATTDSRHCFLLRSNHRPRRLTNITRVGSTECG